VYARCSARLVISAGEIRNRRMHPLPRIYAQLGAASAGHYVVVVAVTGQLSLRDDFVTIPAVGVLDAPREVSFG
jgi:hypothetical protein